MTWTVRCGLRKRVMPVATERRRASSSARPAPCWARLTKGSNCLVERAAGPCFGMPMPISGPSNSPKPCLLTRFASGGIPGRRERIGSVRPSPRPTSQKACSGERSRTNRDWASASVPTARPRLRGVPHNPRAGHGRFEPRRNTGCRGARSKSRIQPRSAASQNSPSA